MGCLDCGIDIAARSVRAGGNRISSSRCVSVCSGDQILLFVEPISNRFNYSVIDLSNDSSNGNADDDSIGHRFLVPVRIYTRNRIVPHIRIQIEGLRVVNHGVRNRVFFGAPVGRHEPTHSTAVVAGHEVVVA